MTTPETNVKLVSVNGEAIGGCKAPDWLKAELFEPVLRLNVPNFKRMQNFKAQPALTAGENYATLMLRLEIDVELSDGQEKHVTYMLKLPQENELFKELMRSYNIFAGEFIMYTQIVPEFEQMYRDVGVQVKFCAACYDVKTPSEFGVILLEDLRPAGFKNAKRLEGLDLVHTKCVLKKLAQFHAASAVRFETKGRYATIFEKGFFMENQRAMMKTMHDTTGKYILESAKGYKDHEMYMDVLQKVQNNLTDETFENAKIEPHEFNVLNHGDCWVNNIMFQYDAAGTIQQTLFVDYQLSKYGSPALDLYYFLLSSTQFDLKLRQFDYFIKYYHENLVEHLKLLKYDKKLPTLKDILVQLYKHGIWGYYTAEGVMAFVLVEPNENANVDNYLNDSEEGNNFKKLMYTNARFSKNMEAIIPWLFFRGALEF